MKLYISQHSESDLASSIAYWKDYMIERELSELELELTEVSRTLTYFWCKEFQEIGEIGNCGKSCEAYTPRNGKSGACVHYSKNFYEETGVKYVLRYNNGKFHLKRL